MKHVSFFAPFRRLHIIFAGVVGKLEASTWVVVAQEWEMRAQDSVEASGGEMEFAAAKVSERHGCNTIQLVAIGAIGAIQLVARLPRRNP